MGKTCSEGNIAHLKSLSIKMRWHLVSMHAF
jgi:hypothetical protein